MALTTQQIQSAYVTFFSRPADVAGLNYWSSYAGSVADLYATFAQSKEYSSIFDKLSNSQKVAAVYQNLFGRAPELEGLNYWTLQLDQGNVTVDGLALTVAAGAQGSDATIVANRVIAATTFTNSLDTGDKALAYQGDAANTVAKQWLSSVTDDASLAAANTPAKIGSVVDSMSGTSTGGATAAQVLKIGQDTLTGTSGNDTFKASVVQNDHGQQVNTFGSGDVLEGGAGVDTLDAKVTTGAYINGGLQAMPIHAETNSIENILFQAVSNGANTQVVVNAEDMVGVKKISSNQSEASLLVQNLTTKGSEKLTDLTVGMSYTNNQGTGNPNFTVKFDQDYLTPESTRTNPTIDFLAMNEDGYDASKGAKPLEGVFFRQLQFTLNGTKFDLVPYLAENRDGAGAEIVTYADFLAAVQKALVELKAANPANAALQSVTASFGQKFTTDVDPVTLVLREGTAVRLTVDGLTNGEANTMSVAKTDLEVARAAGATVPNNNRYEIADNTPPTAGNKLGINVELEKVGLAGKGGDLIIGSMNDGGNTWKNGADTVVKGTTSGIEEFYVTVNGDSTKSSWLNRLESTNNHLRVVTVATEAAQTGAKGYADLTVDNLKDVQILDASAFKGNLKVNANLTQEVVEKYLDIKDQAAAAPAADNKAFVYTGGTGNDSIKLNVSSNNFEKQGNATREDFSVNIAGGAGNDTIELTVDNGFAFGAGTAWYANQKLNANLRINAGEGDDIIKATGSGDVIIDAGAGNDTVYADNYGPKAAFVFNNAAGSIALNDLQSDANNSYKLFKSTVSVNFKGFEASAAIADVLGVATDLDINQAIKKAINEDAVLSKLLVATDGPANTLVVTSLIDGALVTGDLALGLVLPAAITAGEAAQLKVWWSDAAVVDGTSALAAMTTVKTAFDAKADYATELSDVVGVASAHISDNTITGGAGNDVLVLGTGAESNDTLVYTGLNNGTDSIVNFTAGDVATVLNADKIQFTGYNATAVYVGGVLVAGTAAAVGQSYITLVEGTGAAAGSYTATQFTEAGATDTTVGVIGTLDFGASQVFVAGNFAL